jgi:hypothetical protein
MKKLTFVLSALLAMLFIAPGAFAQAHDHGDEAKKDEKKSHHGKMHHGMMHHGTMQHDAAHDADSTLVHPTMVDGVQVVEIAVGPMGYSASKIALQAGVPARLIFTRSKEGGCTHRVQISELGIEPTDLPVGEPVSLEFTPDEAGMFAIACGMEMEMGMLLVRL